MGVDIEARVSVGVALSIERMRVTLRRRCVPCQSGSLEQHAENTWLRSPTGRRYDVALDRIGQRVRQRREGSAPVARSRMWPPLDSCETQIVLPSFRLQTQLLGTDTVAADSKWKGKMPWSTTGRRSRGARPRADARRRASEWPELKSPPERRHPLTSRASAAPSPHPCRSRQTPVAL